MALVLPFDPKYAKLSVFDQFEATTEALLEEERKPFPDIELMQLLHEERHAVRIECVLKDPVWDLTNNLFVADLEGNKKLFTLSSAQEEYDTEWRRCEENNLPCRMVVVKARRVWASEWASKRGYRHLSRNENLNGIVVAHDAPSTQAIFRKYTYVYRNDALAPEAERANKTEIVFSKINSSISCRTAGNQDAAKLGAGQTLHFLHLDEAALWPVNPRGIFTVLMAAVPPPPVFTAVLIISTGRGMNGFFYDEALRAKAGEGGWKLIFTPWHRRREARLAFCAHAGLYDCLCDQARQGRELFDKTLDEREKLLKSEYLLSLEQLYWYRKEYTDNVRGVSPDDKLRWLHQEHPNSFVQAFASTGASAFDITRIDALAPKCKPPVLQGEIVPPRQLWDKFATQIIKETPRPLVRRKPEGPLKVWEAPKERVRYSIGVDLAEGLNLKGDFSVAVVFRRDQPRKFVAMYRQRVGPKGFLTPVRLLSKWYNDALICPEVNFAPTFAEDLKQTDRLGMMYWRINPDRSRVMDEYGKQFGWRTNAQSKRNLVELMKEKLEYEPDIFTFSDLFEEMKAFEEAVTETGQVHYPGAPEGGSIKDDIVIAAMLALQCDFDMPMRGDGPVQVRQERTLETRLTEMFAGQARQARMDQNRFEPGY